MTTCPDSFPRRSFVPPAAAAAPLPVRRLLLTVVCLFSAALAPAFAQSAPAAGSIQGRVLNVDNGSYLTNARVTVEGTSLETFTNAYGQYRLPDVPAGEAKVDIFYTGLQSQTLTVAVQSGQTATQDVSLTAGTAAKNQVVKLDPFVVASQKYADQKAIAINEQRFAPNIRDVVSTDQFGDITEGNIGEFVKFLPGVSVDYTAADARNIMLRGISPQYTLVTNNGMPMASAASSSASRIFELEQVSINNVARIEIIKSRTPDIAAAALGGSVNLVPRSAFELNHAQFTYRAYLSGNSYYDRLGKSPGPGNSPSSKILPGADFSYSDPVNDHFGFTVSFLDSNVRAPQYRSNPQWAPNGVNKNITGVSSADPFLEKYTMQDGPKTSTRISFGGTMDWKISSANVLSFTAQDNFYDSFFGNRNINFDTGSSAPASWGPTFTDGAVGKGSVQYGSSFRHKYGVTFDLGTKFVHSGSIWTTDAALDYSHASSHYQDQQGGYFEGATYKLSNVTVDYTGITPVSPAGITVANKSGQAVNPNDVGNYTLTGTDFNPANSEDLFRTAQANAKRLFNLGAFPTTFKAGVLVQQEVRDIRGGKVNYNFTGPNAAGAANTYGLVDTSYSAVAPPYGYPPVIWPSNYAAYSLFVAHPEYFAPTTAANIQAAVNGSLFLTERVSAAYLMGDTRALDNRLRAVYGLRFERTDDRGAGPLVNPNAIYQHDANGNLVLGTNGKPVLITTDPVQQTVLEYQDRGAHSNKSYASAYPSANVSYNLTDSLILRAAYSRSIGRPNLSNIIPNISLPDPNAAAQVLTVANPALAAEQANNYDLSLEYYFNPSGVISLGAFRKDFTNFFGTITQPATLDLLNSLNVPNPDQYVGDDVQTTVNAGSARITGIEFNYSQGLKFVPGVSVFLNGTALHLEGSPNADFTNFISKTINWGLAYDNRRVSVKLNWNYRGRERMGALSYDPSAYEYFKPRLYLDVNFEYRLTDHVGLFLNGRNITNAPQDDQRYGASTPVYAQLYRRELFGSVYTAGVKGTF